MQENAKFWASFFTDVNAPENAAHAKAETAMDRRDLSQGVAIIAMPRNGPKIPATEDTVQSRYV